MKPGLTTLADLPALASGKNPTTTIVVARLDDKLRDPRYGAFKITQSDVDGWKRNLTDTFGGRVAIDADHSSDRGGGTRAMGWITNIGQDGKLITADVQWTPRGAKAIRHGDYRHISPTFVADYSDEHGEKHGKALIGAALTNRPVLRAGMPALSLSRDTFDGVAVPRKPKKNGRPMKKSKSKTVKLSQKRLRKLAIAAGEDPDRARLMARPGGDPEMQLLWLQSILPGDSAAVTLGAEIEGRARIMMAKDADPDLGRMFLAQVAELAEPPAPASSAPLGMDDDRYQLHQDAKQLARTRCDADPRLDAAETYAAAAIELADRDNPTII